MPLSDDDKKWISEALYGMETRLLTEFHKWASPLESRVRRHRDTLHDLELEIEAITNRLQALEDRQGGKQ